MKKLIRLRMRDSRGIAFPQLAGPPSTKPTAQAQPHTEDKHHVAIDLNAIHRAFWAKNGL